MNCCGHCQDAGKFFNLRTAKRELRRYKRKGPNKSTRLLLDEIRKTDLSDKTLLDIGGGVGTISFELIEHGIEFSTHVDASEAYLEISKKEAENRKLKDRIDYKFADFTKISKDTTNADIVTLDRVICCYPDMEKLVDCSTEKANLYYGIVFPRERWPVRLGMKIGNAWFKLRGSDFRTYLHSPENMDAKIRSNNFQMVRQMKTIIWKAVLYKRVG